MMQDKFSRLGARVVGEPTTNPHERLLDFEHFVGASMPEAYRKLLCQFKNAVSFDKSVCYRPIQRSAWDGKDGTQGVNLLYGPQEDDNGLHYIFSVYDGRIPKYVIPIAEAPGGNQICLHVKDGTVFFWDHEDERAITGDQGNDFGNMYLIAESFEAFVKSLDVEDEVAVEEGDDDGIVDVWLDDDL